MQKKDYGKALKCFEDGMLCHPESQEALQGIIEVLIELKDLETAMECIDTLLKINPKNEVGLYNKNKVLKLLKKKETNKDLNTAKPLETSFSHNKGILKKISQINFGLMSPENIRKMSVTKIVTPDTYDEDGYPIEAGLMHTVEFARKQSKPIVVVDIPTEGNQKLKEESIPTFNSIQG